MIPDWQKRMLEEYKELKEKTKKLYKFIISDEFIKLSKLERLLLEQQNKAMMDYMKTLGYRLDLYHLEH